MAYVSERITREEDKEYFKSFNFTSILRKPLRPSWWAIDRENESFLFSRGGGAMDVPQSYGLMMDGELIEMRVKEQTEGEIYDNNLKIHWIIYKIEVPEKLLEKGYSRDEIRKNIVEAFLGLGTTGIERSKIIDVTVEINVPFTIKKGK